MRAARTKISSISGARVVVFWFATGVIATESVVGGIWDILRTDYVRDVLEVQLGYPPYVAIILGICKIPGALVLLAPGFPRLKEWVYAGMIFIYTGAVISHLAVGDVAGAIGPVGFTVITMTSWALRPCSRRDLAAGTGFLDRLSTPAVTSGKALLIWYWATTGVIVFVLLTGGLADLSRRPETAAGVLALGYPLYFVSILGSWKLLGVAVLLAPRFPRLKEWAYAGAFYNFAGAFTSHLVSGSDANHLIWTGLFSVCTIASWALRPHDRRSLGSSVTFLRRDPSEQ
ncbi:DoxX family protein [Pseudonocardia sp. MH-G8]|uniref:DoxX family protein n=1 Tax=Pseudonocardia sp. MH-G8 TaxID=1854588 RepID=UPI001E44B325|nr:DoxX family protein [Pseudonocardia sp. MH-G8]